MAVGKSAQQGFQSDWSKTVAWAQTQGIKRDSYYPIYQMDSARLLAGETPMSTSERTRAILAASDPKNVTPVPADKPDPANILGNTVNDLKNIFTGLAPNHLITNVYDTVKNSIIHPSTWIHPLEEIGGGALTGNMGEVKTGFEQAAGLTGPGSILSWLPGVYDAGEFAQGGLSEVLSHPVQSFLDVTPFADTGGLLAAAAGSSRAASIAAKLGMSTDQLRDASFPGMAKSFILSKKAGDVGFLAKHLDTNKLTDLATGKPLTIGQALDKWITGSTGMGKTLSALMKGALDIGERKTDAQLALERPAAMAFGALNEEQKHQLDDMLVGKDPKYQGKTRSQLMQDHSIDPQVRTAYGLQEDVLSWVKETALATGAVAVVPRSDGTSAFVETAGQVSPVADAFKAAQAAQDALIKAMEPNTKLAQESALWDKQMTGLAEDFGRTWKSAQIKAEELDGTMRMDPVKISEGTSRLSRDAYVRLNLKEQAMDLFGRTDKAGGGMGSGRDGIMGMLSTAINDKNFAAVREVSAGALRRLSHNGVGAIDAGLDPVFAELRHQVELIHSWSVKRIEWDTKFVDNLLKKEGGAFSAIRPALNDYRVARRAFIKSVYDHSTADVIDMAKEQFIKNLVAQEKTYGRMAEMSKKLAAAGMAKDAVERLRSDPVKMAQLVILDAKATTLAIDGIELMTPAETEALWRSSVKEAEKLRSQGYGVSWVPKISSLDLDSGRYGIKVGMRGTPRKSSRAFKKNLAHTATRYDAVASIHLAAKEALQIDGTIEYAEHILAPHLVTVADAYKTFLREFGPEIEHYQSSGRDAMDLFETTMKERFHMKRFDSQATFGFTLPRMGTSAVYIPEEIAKAIDKMQDGSKIFPVDGVVDKITKTFRFSILGLSPRYTAHVVFGGTFLLALRSSPGLVKALPAAWNIMKDKGEVPRGAFDGATQRGVEPSVYRTFHDSPRNVAARAYHQKMGADAGRYMAEEHIEKFQGVKLAAAKPYHWLKAVGDLNYTVTNFAAGFQRAAAYVDHFNKVSKDKTFTDPVTGEKMTMTKERAGKLAMDHSLKVMGDLKAMTPLERNVLTQIFPFYGWSKHILQYVGTFPVDHPYRAQFLSTLATQNSNDVASGLPKRLQFLMFLGSPDAQGNVNAVDVRSFDPLRDVANYATLAGLVSSLNPVLTAPLAMIDPNIIFGGNPLYPNVTYDSFYGIESAGSQGSPLTALEQVVPQVSAIGPLASALNLSGDYRQLASANPNAFAKKIFEALNIPMAQIQHLNLKQIAAKDELDRYHVASQAASNAFASGNFSAIGGLSSVPDPLNAEYEVTPAYLSDLYNQLLQQYPGQNPVETATPPPPAPL